MPCCLWGHSTSCLRHYKRPHHSAIYAFLFKLITYSIILSDKLLKIHHKSFTAILPPKSRNGERLLPLSQAIANQSSPQRLFSIVNKIKSPDTSPLFPRPISSLFFL